MFESAPRKPRACLLFQLMRYVWSIDLRVLANGVVARAC